jgi:hypothetical protein
MSYGLDNYERLDIHTLSNVVTNPETEPEVRRAAFNALVKITPDERRVRLLAVMRAVIQRPDRFEYDIFTDAVEIFATDPHPDATAFMLELLPELLALAMKQRSALPDDVRQYFYQALVTRTRPEDLLVWEEWVKNPSGRTLVAIILDPAALPLEAIEPMTLLARLDEPERTRALFTVVVGLANQDGPSGYAEEAVRLLGESHHPEHFAQGLDALTDRSEKARKEGRDRTAEHLEHALGILDNRPRTAMEKLRGKRPWAER